jgi:hypothetical protein
MYTRYPGEIGSGKRMTEANVWWNINPLMPLMPLMAVPYRHQQNGTTSNRISINVRKSFEVLWIAGTHRQCSGDWGAGQWL